MKTSSGFSGQHARIFATTALGLALAACGGGGGSSSGGASVGPPPPPNVPPPPVIVDPIYLVSAASPFANGCDGVAADGTLYVNSEVEPYVTINPQNTNNIVGVWQQDRWSTGGARGLVAGASFDGGKTWSRTPLPFSRCGGGNAGNHADFSRASDPWVSFGPNSIVYAISISFDGGIQAPGSDSAVLASRSLDGGKTWSAPSTLILDGSTFFNDKESITADPKIGNFAYAVWDRLPPQGGGPATFTRTTHGGASWEAARSIYDPGVNSQTLGNEIVVLPNGMLIDLFTQIDSAAGVPQKASAMIIRSADQGVTWSGPIKVADLLAVGAKDPENGSPVRDGADLPQIAVSPSGVLFMTWADGRFSGGVRDGIAITHSSDGGLTWSVPTQLNGSTASEAFEPSVHVRNDGTVTVTYFDFRNDTSTSDLPTILWLARSTDAVSWHESAIAGPFDLENAPVAEGLFVGDYQGLSSLGSVSEPFFVTTNKGNIANRTDVFSAPAVSVTTMFNLVVRALGVTAMPARPFVMTRPFHQRVVENLSHVMDRREVQWRNAIRERQGLPPLGVPERD